MGAGEIFQGKGSGGQGGGKRGGEGEGSGDKGEGSGGRGPPCPPPEMSVISKGSLKCQRVTLSDMPNWGDVTRRLTASFRPF